MKRFFTLISLISMTILHADSSTYSRDRLIEFYEEFLCDEKNDLSSVGITAPCTFTPPGPPNPFVPPPNPTPPPYQTGMLPIVIANNSGYGDDQVYIVMTGKNTAATSQVFVELATPSSGIGSLHLVANGDNSTTYSYLLSQLPQTSGGARVFYIPQITSGLVWFSIENKLNMPVNPDPFTLEPSIV